MLILELAAAAAEAVAAATGPLMTGPLDRRVLLTPGAHRGGPLGVLGLLHTSLTWVRHPPECRHPDLPVSGGTRVKSASSRLDFPLFCRRLGAARRRRVPRLR